MAARRPAVHPEDELADRAADPGLQAIVLMGRLGLRLTSAMVEHPEGPSTTGNAPLMVISLLALEGPTRPGRLARLTGLTSGGVSHLVERLEEQGLVVRSAPRARGDRRAVEVCLSPAGSRLAAVVAEVAQGEAAAIRDFARQVLATLDAGGPRSRSRDVSRARTGCRSGRAGGGR